MLAEHASTLSVTMQLQSGQARKMGVPMSVRLSAARVSGCAHCLHPGTLVPEASQRSEAVVNPRDDRHWVTLQQVPAAQPAAQLSQSSPTHETKPIRPRRDVKALPLGLLRHLGSYCKAHQHNHATMPRYRDGRLPL